MKYLICTLRMIVIIILLIGTLNNAFAQIGYDGLLYLKNLLEIKTCLHSKLYIMCGLCIIILVANKYFWLPFLGDTSFPHSLIPEHIIEGDTTVIVNVKPNIKVAYWASLPSDQENVSVINAYDKYQNAGVVKSNNNGEATLIFNKGSGYNLPTGFYINPHVHYREIYEDTGFLGPVRTHYLD